MKRCLTDVCLSRKSFHSDSYVFFHVLQDQKLNFVIIRSVTT